MKTNCYAQTAQIRKIRKKMMEIMTKEAGTVQLRELVKKLIPESIGKEIEKQAQGIFPLKDALIRKVKIIKKPTAEKSSESSAEEWRRGQGTQRGVAPWPVGVVTGLSSAALPGIPRGVAPRPVGEVTGLSSAETPAALEGSLRGVAPWPVGEDTGLSSAEERPPLTWPDLR